VRPRAVSLDVYVGQEFAGELTRPGAGRVRFQHSDHVRERYAGANLLSASMPVREEAYPNGEAKPFFEGLLPEGVVRERVASELHVSYDNVHGLLEKIGVECAGAVVIVPHGEVPPDPAQAELEWLTDDELEERIRDLPNHPLGISPGRVRLSLGGIQDKLVLVRSPAGRFASPLHGAPSTHIIKPGQGRYDGIVANEAFCLRVAACCRLTVARSEIAAFGDHQSLVVERFDRTFGAGNRIERLHQEDFCQALGVRPSAKYESDGGPSIAALVHALRRLSTRAAADVVTFLRSVILNYLIGNSDAHGKNYAILYDPLTQGRLAPLYDLVSTAVYDVEQDLAMSIGGVSDPEAIARDAWEALAAETGVAERQLLAEVRDMSERVGRCVASVRDQALAEDWHEPVIDEIAAISARRIQTTLAVLG
jgi:serine/threonine-protein kinase HipA